MHATWPELTPPACCQTIIDLPRSRSMKVIYGNRKEDTVRNSTFQVVTLMVTLCSSSLSAQDTAPDTTYTVTGATAELSNRGDILFKLSLEIQTSAVYILLTQTPYKLYNKDLLEVPPEELDCGKPNYQISSASITGQYRHQSITITVRYTVLVAGKYKLKVPRIGLDSLDGSGEPWFEKIPESVKAETPSVPVNEKDVV
ncbi:MAG: hypothetical protein ACI9VM_000644 [Candidatus Azotimanducaceae bacterium]|jgi:hypothetical protein